MNKIVRLTADRSSSSAAIVAGILGLRQRADQGDTIAEQKAEADRKRLRRRSSHRGRLRAELDRVRVRARTATSVTAA